MNPKRKTYNTKQRLCTWCGLKFVPEYATSKYCSKECFDEHRKDRLRLEAVTCDKCGKEFRRAKIRIKKLNYCSIKCAGIITNSKVKRICKTCGKEYEVYKSQILHRGSSFCSIKCSRTKFRGKTPKQNNVDNLWSEIVKTRAGNKCEYCGIERSLNSHHIFSRSNHSVRWDVNNGICLCASHHLLGNFSAHKAPLEFADWIKEKRGEEWYDNLKRKSKEIYKPDYQVIYDNLRKLLPFIPDDSC